MPPSLEQPEITALATSADTVAARIEQILLSGNTPLAGRKIVRDGLLRVALTHSSFSAENPSLPSNERLEFLGDSVISIIVANYIYKKYPELAEGDLAKLRAAVVATSLFSTISEKLAIPEALLLGQGEFEKGRSKSSILGDAFEAVIGAIYIENGLEVAEVIVLELLGDLIERESLNPGGYNFKSRLQEYLATKGIDAPLYRISFDSPDHDRNYYAEVWVQGEHLGGGQGKSKKAA
ncbi:MAG: ribonuclease III, partial [Acidimicrobiales bacterium]|nr:ribonuclease III [Acidimicrobiales bacterium]